MIRVPRLIAPLMLAVCLTAAVACADDDTGTDAGSSTTAAPGASTTTATANSGGPSTTAPGGEAAGSYLLSGQGNDLVAYGLDDFTAQVVITNAGDDPENGKDINGQVCFIDDGVFVAGEDTGQPDPPAGFGIFELTGDGVGDLAAEQVGKLTPTYQEGEDDPEPYSCTVLEDGRFVTLDIGNQDSGPANGQLIVWFPPIEGEDVPYCKVDIEIATPQQAYAIGNDLLLASARPPTAGVWKYTDLPTGPDAAGGCGQTDSTGAPLADEISKEIFIPVATEHLFTANGIAPTPDGGWYISSVITGGIAEFDAEGEFVRIVLEPPAGESLQTGGTFSTGTPLGLGIDSEGSLYYADIGIVRTEDTFGPGPATGKVRVITFTDGEPDPPVIIDEGLDFPDAVAIVEP